MISTVFRRFLPTELVLGFFFGAPIREYILLATTLPYALLCVGFGVPSAHGLIQIVIALIAFAWLFHGMALLSALLAKPRVGSRGTIGLIVFLVIMITQIAGAFLSRSSLLVDLDQRLSLFGISLPWLAVVLIYIAAILFFIYLAARRRMASERIHPLSKVQGDRRHAHALRSSGGGHLEAGVVRRLAGRRALLSGGDVDRHGGRW